jgi:hypothetical protein
MGWRTQDDSLRMSLAAQQNEIDAIKSAQSELDLASLEGLVDILTMKVASFDARITELEARPIAPETPPVDAAVIEGVRAEVTAMQAELEAQRDEFEGLLANARTITDATASAARAASKQRVLAEITSAISDGRSFAAALDEMTANGVTDLSAALTDVASEGVVTLTNLQTRFPDVARAALLVARTSMVDTEDNGLGGFLLRQLGARSVAPREGNDADAVLSRAEAALRDGRVSEALTEIDALPDAAQDAMQDWIVDARMRGAAEVAVQELSQRLTAN